MGELGLRLPAGATNPRVRVTHDTRPVPATIAADGVDVTVTLGSVATVSTYTTLTATLSW